jgi:hypothetical protein
VRVVDEVEDLDRVSVASGLLEVEALPLPLLHPLSVGEAVEEWEGEGVVEGVAGVGM